VSAGIDVRDFRAMGTSCRVAAAIGRHPRAAQGAVDCALIEIARCERVMTRFDGSSDLSRANAHAGDWVRVDPILVDALTRAVTARAETGGLYDPTVLPAVVAAGYDRTFEEIAGTARAPVSLDGWRAGAGIDVDVDGARVRLAPGAAIDLGGIGKGYTATRALEAMQNAYPALPGGLVDLGGDIAVAGSAPGGPWRVAIADPRQPGRELGVLVLRGAGVATSGRDRRRFGPDLRQHHLIDPETGAPAGPGPLTVTAVAPDATLAETSATALAILPVADARGYVERRPWLSALLVPHEGRVERLGRLPLEHRNVVRWTVAR
jgi:thiamine biosynthesis lipoprotein